MSAGRIASAAFILVGVGVGLALQPQATASPGSPPPPPTNTPPPPLDGAAPPPYVGPPAMLDWYKFNGDLSDSSLRHLAFHPYTNNAGPKYEAGKDGTNPGAIVGFGFLDAKNGFVWPSLTISFTVWPQSALRNGATGGVYACRSAAVFSNTYRVNTTYVRAQSVGITGCPDDASDKGSVDVWFDLATPPGTPVGQTQVIFSHPLRSNMWHDVSVVFDGSTKKITLIIDGQIAKSQSFIGAMRDGPIAQNRVFIGMQSDQGWTPGLLDDLKLYATAYYPLTARANPVGPVGRER